MNKLSQLQEEYNELTEELSNPEIVSDWERFQEISKRRKDLEKIVTKYNELEKVQQTIEENKQIIDAEESPELSVMAEQELNQLQTQEQSLQKELDDLIKKNEEDLPSALILEIRSGTGGDEAALFARDLWTMYQNYASNQGWKVKVLNTSETEIGGIKEVALEIEGEEAFAKLRYEGGVHRVQRIPSTEKQGRIHTSTVSVAILPKPKKEEVQLNNSDVKMEFTTSSGPGGQNVNKRETAVRLIHIPTGLTIVAENSRTQQANKEAAYALMQARLLERQVQEQEQERSGQRKSQIGGAERSEKIRTYNYPQDRITDHRIKQSWHGIEKTINEGSMDPIVHALQEAASIEE